MYNSLLPASTALKPEDIHPKPERLMSGRSDNYARVGSSGRKPPLNKTMSRTFNEGRLHSKPPRIRSALPQMRRKVANRTNTEKSVLEHEMTSGRPPINIKTANRTLPERSCLSTKSRGSTTG